MSDFHAIDIVGSQLSTLLFNSFTADPDVGQFFQSPDQIQMASPTETAQQASNQLSIFLYQITEDPHTKNRPPVPEAGTNRLMPPPMALRFHYLLTPFGPTPAANALILSLSS